MNPIILIAFCLIKMLNLILKDISDFGLGFLINPTDEMVTDYQKFLSLFLSELELNGNSLLSKSMNKALNIM